MNHYDHSITVPEPSSALLKALITRTAEWYEARAEAAELRGLAEAQAAQIESYRKIVCQMAREREVYVGA